MYNQTQYSEHHPTSPIIAAILLIVFFTLFVVLCFGSFIQDCWKITTRKTTNIYG
jgi:hypothetical protein